MSRNAADAVRFVSPFDCVRLQNLLRGIARFTTTLASSRWKNLDQVNAAGQEAAEHYADVQYWDKNWRKDGLQDRRNALLKFYGFYNQTWCGCEFSYRDAQKRASEIATRLAAQSNKLST